jgi:hypothetical protein
VWAQGGLAGNKINGYNTGGAGVNAIGASANPSQYQYGYGGDGIDATAGIGGAQQVNPGDGLAGKFSGNVAIGQAPDGKGGNLSVVGSITAGTKDFKIDDPRDPANKFLVHTSIESPDALNVYSGNVTTDGKGYATVGLPAYFDAENTDPRYQLTVIGAFAQAIVWKEEQHNQFVIRTNQPDVKVSWQVSAVRNDPYARSVRAPAEQWKPAGERGRYLYPSVYGKPSAMAIYQLPKLTESPPSLKPPKPAPGPRTPRSAGPSAAPSAPPTPVVP